MSHVVENTYAVLSFGFRFRNCTINDKQEKKLHHCIHIIEKRFRGKLESWNIN